MLQSDEELDYYGGWSIVCVGNPDNCPYVSYVDTLQCLRSQPIMVRQYQVNYKGATASGDRYMAGVDYAC